jgi:hypothetical protein
MPDEVEAILAAIQSLAKREGVRVAEICGALERPIEPVRIKNVLEAQVRAGTVRHDPVGGRWSLLHAPSRPARGPRAGATGIAASPMLPVVSDTGIPMERDDDGVVDPSQRVVSRAPCNARQVVIAGPGFGKTAVSCARVAWLLREGIEASRVLLLSFTRTAVRELRARIASLSGDAGTVASIEVSTLDSFAWRLRTGLSETPRTVTSFGASIEGAVAMLLKPDSDLRAYLDCFDHVLVDESQDLVGARASLVIALLGALQPEAGYTVFLDPAQAIYDWSEELDEGRESRSFETQLRALTPAPVWRELAHLHRTRDPALRALLLGARRLVLDASADACTQLRAVLEGRATGERRFADALALEVRDRADPGLLVLARRRGEALELSSRLSQLGVRHRLRFGALPQLAAPWIAAVLNEACQTVGAVVVTESDVQSAWETVAWANPWLVAGWHPEAAWRLLRRLGSGPMKHQIDIRRVSERLGGATLPDDALLRELGGEGPIVSTVHGSKGREADVAMLLLSAQNEHSVDEARVLYVGLSRARERVDVRRFGGARWGHLKESGRPWRRTSKGHLQIEVGRVGDLDVVRTASIISADFDAQQAALATFDGVCRTVRVLTFKDAKWARCVVTDGDAPTKLAVLSTSCEDDLRGAVIAMGAGQRRPTYVNHLRWFDLGSVGLARDVMLDGDVPEPWQTTRLFLMPVVVGPGVAGGYSDRNA